MSWVQDLEKSGETPCEHWLKPWQFECDMGSTMDLAARGVHPALHTEAGLGIWDNGLCFNLNLGISI